MIIADKDENVEIAALLAAEAKSIGAEVALTILGTRKGLHHEPPKFIAESMKHADIVIGVIYGLLHTEARKNAQAAGARFAIMGGVRVGQGKEYLANLDFNSNDLNLIEKRGTKLADMVTQANTASITCEEGTDLTISLLNRNGLAVLPVCRDPKVFCLLVDYSEVACAPVEGSAEGALVIDGTILSRNHPELDRVVKEPIWLEIRQGKIEEISGGRDARDFKTILSNLDPNAKVVGEFGIGTNHNVMKLRGVVRDKANLGSIHIGLGENTFIGGGLNSEDHIDLMITKPTLELDDCLIINKGELKL